MFFGRCIFFYDASEKHKTDNDDDQSAGSQNRDKFFLHVKNPLLLKNYRLCSYCSIMICKFKVIYSYFTAELMFGKTLPFLLSDLYIVLDIFSYSDRVGIEVLHPCQLL